MFLSFFSLRCLTHARHLAVDPFEYCKRKSLLFRQQEEALPCTSFCAFGLAQESSIADSPSAPVRRVLLLFSLYGCLHLMIFFLFAAVVLLEGRDTWCTYTSFFAFPVALKSACSECTAIISEPPEPAESFHGRRNIRAWVCTCLCLPLLSRLDLSGEAGTTPVSHRGGPSAHIWVGD